ncbi:MAG: SDR family oxidoreductase [Gammaproteobacteria bacterium]|nr:SDR family oxidoreductase [Gammaproteobacteria bacterium]
MAEAWSRDGIMCNALAPGFLPTVLAAPVCGDEDIRAWAAGQTAIGRNGTIAGLAGPTLFLAAPASHYMSGQIICMDGYMWMEVLPLDESTGVHRE